MQSSSAVGLGIGRSAGPRLASSIVAGAGRTQHYGVLSDASRLRWRVFADLSETSACGVRAQALCHCVGSVPTFRHSAGWSAPSPSARAGHPTKCQERSGADVAPSKHFGIAPHPLLSAPRGTKPCAISRRGVDTEVGTDVVPRARGIAGTGSPASTPNCRHAAAHRCRSTCTRFR